ncbi:MAG: cardiolipin synthase [Eubacteriales bacterium]|nr:cardiolipin synthase [Eubacteriales bacterium]
MLKAILLILYIATILAVIFAERKNSTEAILWVLVMICIPYAGILLYLIFGSTAAIKLTSIFRRRRLSKRLPAAKAPQDLLTGQQFSDEDLQVIQFNTNYNNSPVTCYDDYQLFITGESHYRALFQDIKEATENIYVLFYAIHHDVIGESLVNVLTEKAKQGVTVLVMCDFIANLSTPNKMFKPLVDAGGKVIRVKPYLTHYRSHRKIVAIDHKIGYIGGMNIGKQYANLAEKKNPWRDTQIRLTGACVATLDAYFLTDLLCAVRQRDWENMVTYMESLQLPPQRRSPNLCQFVVGGVDNNKEAVKMNYLSMIRSAKKKIRIQSPYFIPDVSVLDALKTAAASGVKIELMIPGIKASFFLDPVTTYYAGQIMEFGAKVYKYHGYIHAKTMTIDDELCCIGSVNMDMRSLMVDDEICGIFYENSMVQEYIDIFENDILNCDSYLYEQFLNRGQKEKFMECIFLPFAPLM